MKSKLRILAVAAMTTMFLGASLDAMAGKYGGSSRASSYSFSSSKSYSSNRSSSSYGWGGSAKSSNSSSTSKPTGWGGSTKAASTKSKPAVTASKNTTKTTVSTTKTQTSKSGWGASNSKTTNGKPVVSSTAKKTKLASAPTKHFTTEKQKAAYKKYQDSQKGKFKGKANPVKVSQTQTAASPLYQKAADNTDSSKTYWDRRDRLYTGWNAPTYVYGGSPSYGMFDGMFLGYMLGHAMSPGYSSFAYNHQNDPGMQAWMREMEARSETDAELRAQLASLKAEMAKMNGKPIDPTYLPEDVDADMVMSPDMVANLKPVYRLCTADKNGNYSRFGQLVRTSAANDVNVQIVNTAGSMQNLQYIQEGKCDGAYVQRNAFTAYAKRNPNGHFNFERVATPAIEFAHMVCGRDSDVDNVGDLIGKTLLIGDTGSGTEVTWSDFTEMDHNYLNVKTEHVGGVRALNKVATGQADCMMYVASLNTNLMNKANAMGDRLVMVPVNDWDFNSMEYGGGKLFSGHKDQSGEEVYTFYDIPGGQYPNIQDGIVMSSVETLTVPVDMVSSLDWGAKHSDAYDGLISGVMTAQRNINNATREH